MGFVNEFIPAEDFKKYRIEEIDKKFVPGASSRQWTIDREREIFLHLGAMGDGSDPDGSNQTRWTFYWQGDVLTLRLDAAGGGGSEGEPGWARWKLMWLNGGHGLPEHLKLQKVQILEGLKEALVAYQGGGVYSAAYSSYSVTLEIAGDCVI